ncbi:hypothetical protein BSKO_07263 [Bryopsis sp. KO-2023]|nr:hypothetical protein BSKO_07263 [Bryopsis sp. KO-2023]
MAEACRPLWASRSPPPTVDPSPHRDPKLRHAAFAAILHLFNNRGDVPNLKKKRVEAKCVECCDHTLILKTREAQPICSKGVGRSIPTQYCWTEDQASRQASPKR